MKKTFLPFMMVAVSALAAAPSSFALTAAQVKECKVMGADLQKRQTALQKEAASRTSLVEKVELAGEEWDAAEALRNFGADKAVLADEAKADYNTLKAELLDLELDLHGKIEAVNSETAAYNSKCVKK